MKKVSRVFGEAGQFLMGALLASLMGFGCFIAMEEARFYNAPVSEIVTRNQNQAWENFAEFLRRPERCNTLLQGHRLGDSIIGDGRSTPTVGQEWLDSGQVVKEIYLLRREDEVAWNLGATNNQNSTQFSTVYLKVGLVPRPKEKITVDYLLASQATNRIFPVRVALGEVKVLQPQEGGFGELKCQAMAHSQGAIGTIVAAGRSPASGRGLRRPLCVLSADHLPIRKCGEW